MVSRDLLKYSWRYENGKVILLDKEKGAFFEMPISYTDSFIRAVITFKNVYKNEQVLKKLNLVAKGKEREAKLKQTVKNLREKRTKEKDKEKLKEQMKLGV